MSSLRQAAKLALEALEHAEKDVADFQRLNTDQVDEAITALRQALEAEKQDEPVAHSVIAGVLFDFMGYLTSRSDRIYLSSVDLATPAVDAIIEFAEMRGLRLNEAQVKDWQLALKPQPAQQPLSSARIDELIEGGVFGCNPYELVRRIEEERGVFKTRPLTDEQINTIAAGTPWNDFNEEFARAIERAHGITGEKK
jgi:hypothetical protein